MNNKPVPSKGTRKPLGTPTPADGARYDRWIGANLSRIWLSGGTESDLKNWIHNNVDKVNG